MWESDLIAMPNISTVIVLVMFNLLTQTCEKAKGFLWDMEVIPLWIHNASSTLSLLSTT